MLLALLAAARRARRPRFCVAASATAAAALVVASRLNRGYVHTLERSLLNRAVEIDLSDVEDNDHADGDDAQPDDDPHAEPDARTAPDASATSTPRVHVARPTTRRARCGPRRPRRRRTPSTSTSSRSWRSGRATRIACFKSSQRDESLRPSLVAHVIPLLAWDPVADEAVNALRRVAEERVGELIDALVDPNQPFAVRRRLARVFSVCVSQRAVDGLLLGLDDLRFEVRFQAARSLVAILEKNPRVHIDAPFVFEVVRREVAVGRPVWEAHRLLHGPEDGDPALFLDDFVRDRASRSLAHVFTLLSLVLPPEPLRDRLPRAAHRRPRTCGARRSSISKACCRPLIREQLWPFLDESRTPRRATTRSRDEILADLLRSNQSMRLESRSAAGAPQGRAAERPRPPGCGLEPGAERRRRRHHGATAVKVLAPRAPTPVPRTVGGAHTTTRLSDELISENVKRLARRQHRRRRPVDRSAS